MDEQLIIEKIRRDATRQEGFRMLLSAYQERVYWHVRKMVIDHDDADDVTQEIFVKIWKNLEKFREDAKLFTWIYRIATNECLNFLNKQKRRSLVPIEDHEATLGGRLNEADHIDGDEIQLTLQKAILTLPDKQRAVFNMKYFEDLKFDEIADITGTSVGALKASYHLAVKKIEKFINGD
ncbi:MAG: RNA polymerase sigma factor [Bacteroidota bacterium]